MLLYSAIASVNRCESVVNWGGKIGERHREGGERKVYVVKNKNKNKNITWTLCINSVQDTSNLLVISHHHFT